MAARDVILDHIYGVGPPEGSVEALFQLHILHNRDMCKLPGIVFLEKLPRD